MKVRQLVPHADNDVAADRQIKLGKRITTELKRLVAERQAREEAEIERQRREVEEEERRLAMERMRLEEKERKAAAARKAAEEDALRLAQEKALKKKQKKVSELLLQVKMFHAAGDDKEAEKYLIEAQELLPNDPEVFKLIRIIYESSQDFINWKEKFKRIIGCSKKIQAVINELSHKNSVNPALTKAIILVGSECDIAFVSNKGAVGLMPLLPDTARELGIKNRFNPRENIFAGTKYLSNIRKSFHKDGVCEIKWQILAFFLGPSKVKMLLKNKFDPFASKYVMKVQALLEEMGEKNLMNKVHQNCGSNFVR